MTPLRRILVKFSGEALGGSAGRGLDAGVLAAMATEVAGLVEAGVQVGVVVGAGNLCRGAELAAAGLDRVTGDHMGMLATVMNALAFRAALDKQSINAEVLAAHAIATIAEPYSPRRARSLLDAGTVVVHAGGTGNPLFTTDTAACLRAIETDTELVVKATRVDGVYAEDPERNPDAPRFDTLTHAEVLARELGVMDLTAVCLSRDHGLAVVVCNVAERGALTRIAAGEKVGTRIDAEGLRVEPPEGA